MWPNHGGCFAVNALLPLWALPRSFFFLELLVMFDLTLTSSGAHLDCPVVANAALLSLWPVFLQSQLLIVTAPRDSAWRSVKCFTLIQENHNLDLAFNHRKVHVAHEEVGHQHSCLRLKVRCGASSILGGWAGLAQGSHIWPKVLHWIYSVLWTFHFSFLYQEREEFLARSSTFTREHKTTRTEVLLQG